jgi:hypothetical protein
MTLFLDLDGVLADFDGHYAATIGPLPPRNDPKRDVDWDKIAGSQFYAGIPPMDDAFELWDFVKGMHPEILSGVPTTGRDVAEANKRAWVRCWFGSSVPVHLCLAREKNHYAKPGDILVDDWPKYQSLWEAKGGVWVSHTSAIETIRKLQTVEFVPCQSSVLNHVSS